MKYRPEIDGLRAVAVSSVVLFHSDLQLLGYKIFPGGYLGVDIFFVISGYLITSIVLMKIRSGEFTFGDFYERRVRRIFPALLLVTLVSLPVFSRVLSPAELDDFFRSIFYALLSVSNFFFLFREGDYWAPASEMLPFLHTWSLSVEEQFYLVLPAALIAASSARKNIVFPVLAVAACVSLLLCHLWSETRPSAAFYMLPSRGWELLAGALMASAEARWSRPRISPRLVLPLLGSAFFGLFGSMAYFSAETQHPSLLTLVPVVSASIIIWVSGENDPVTSFLRLPPMRFVGLISYSIYLWHFPVFVFGRYAGIFGGWNTIFLIAVVFVLATVSYVAVERPCRDKNFSFGGVLVIIGYCLVALAVSGVGIAFIKDRTSPPVAQVDVKPAFPSLKGRQCDEFERTNVLCRIYGKGEPEYVVWGDSHAQVFSHISKYVQTATYMMIVHPGCPPVSGVRRYDGSKLAEACSNFEHLAYIEEYIGSRASVKLVILAARWTAYINGFHRNNKLYAQIHTLVTDTEMDGVGPAESGAALERQLAAMVARFKAKGLRVVIVEQAPDFQEFSPIQSVASGVPSGNIVRWHEGEKKMLEAVKAAVGVELINVRGSICDSAICRPTLIDGTALYRDDNHLSVEGAYVVLFGQLKKFVQSPVH